MTLRKTILLIQYYDETSPLVGEDEPLSQIFSKALLQNKSFLLSWGLCGGCSSCSEYGGEAASGGENGVIAVDTKWRWVKKQASLGTTVFVHFSLLQQYVLSTLVWPK